MADVHVYWVQIGGNGNVGAEFQPTALAREYKSGDTLCSYPDSLGRGIFPHFNSQQMHTFWHQRLEWTYAGQRSQEGGEPGARRALGCRCEDSRRWARARSTVFEFTRFAHGKTIEIIIFCGSHHISRRGRQSDPGAARSSSTGYKLLK